MDEFSVESRSANYELVAVINHIVEPVLHYTCVIKTADNVWRNYDDSSVTSSKFEDINEVDPYILIYQLKMSRSDDATNQNVSTIPSQASRLHLHRQSKNKSFVEQEQAYNEIFDANLTDEELDFSPDESEYKPVHSDHSESDEDDGRDLDLTNSNSDFEDGKTLFLISIET